VLGLDAVQTEHDERVRAIAAQIAERARRKEPLHIDKGGVHHVVPLPGDRRFRGGAIDISGLSNVLEIDPATRRCVVEPGVTFRDLVEKTIPLGLLPAVVPELEGITVGGAVAGCSVESMSYRYGGFHDRCIEYELITTRGEILSVSRERDPLLFEMTHGSYGTLGVLTKIVFDLVPAKPFVRMNYERFGGPREFAEAVLERAKTGAQDFMDAIVHGPSQFVLCSGHFEDKAPYTSDYKGASIFYKSTAEKAEDHLTTEDYCFRYDTECHWLTRTVPPLEWPLVRKAVGQWFLGSTNLIRWSKRLAPVLALKKRPDVVVDLFIPSSRFLDFFEWYDKAVFFYPLWIVPYRIPTPYPWVAPAQAARIGELVFDCAIYGRPNADPDVDCSQLLEEKTHELGGIKTLISSNHYTPERFWSIYDRANYDAAKARLDPEGAFPGLYEKFHR
jgi:FAD/FMN-containing dehydrogenase